MLVVSITRDVSKRRLALVMYLHRHAPALPPTAEMSQYSHFVWWDWSMRVGAGRSIVPAVHIKPLSNAGSV